MNVVFDLLKKITTFIRTMQIHDFKMWSAFSLLSILSEILRTSFRCQFYLIKPKLSKSEKKNFISEQKGRNIFLNPMGLEYCCWIVWCIWEKVDDWMFPINSKIKDKFQIVLLSCHVSGGHSCIFADKLIIYIYMNLKIKKNSYLIYIHTLLVVWVFVCLSVVSNSHNGGTDRAKFLCGTSPK